jgi:LppP/LprE lipoprotein
VTRRKVVLTVCGAVLALLTACSTPVSTPTTVTVTAPPSAAPSPVAAAPVAPPPVAPPSPTCGPDEATALQSALAKLPPEPVTGRGWQTTPIGGDYKPCADLSTILVMIEGGTASSPVQALMFHRGTYLGTGTSKAYGFTSLNAARSTGETVVLDYATPGECDACAPASVTSVRYQWRGDHVEMLDPPPPS